MSLIRRGFRNSPRFLGLLRCLSWAGRVLERHHDGVRKIQQCLRDELEPDPESRLAGGGTPCPGPYSDFYAGLENGVCPGPYRVIDGGRHPDVSRDNSRRLGGL